MLRIALPTICSAVECSETKPVHWHLSFAFLDEDAFRTSVRPRLTQEAVAESLAPTQQSPPARCGNGSGRGTSSGLSSSRSFLIVSGPAATSLGLLMMYSTTLSASQAYRVSIPHSPHALTAVEHHSARRRQLLPSPRSPMTLKRHTETMTASDQSTTSPNCQSRAPDRDDTPRHIALGILAGGAVLASSKLEQGHVLGALVSVAVAGVIGLLVALFGRGIERLTRS